MTLAHPEPLPPNPTADDAQRAMARDLRQLVEGFGLAPDALPLEGSELMGESKAVSLRGDWVLYLEAKANHVQLALSRHGDLVWGKQLPVLAIPLRANRRLG